MTRNKNNNNNNKSYQTLGEYAREIKKNPLKPEKGLEWCVVHKCMKHKDRKNVLFISIQFSIDPDVTTHY